jgi:hypothetical protein
METTDIIIDLALNVVGFLAAGVLSLVIYSIFRRGDRAATPEPRPAAAAATTTTAHPAETPAPAAPSRPGKVQFVGFGERTEKPSAGNDPLRRNRADVLRIAREMIRTGSSDAEIKAALPISDTELAVLDYERK